MTRHDGPISVRVVSVDSAESNLSSLTSAHAGKCGDAMTTFDRREDRCDAFWSDPNEEDHCMCMKTADHTGRHVCCCGSRTDRVWRFLSDPTDVEAP